MSHNLLVTRLEAAIRKFVYLASRFIIVLAEGRRFLFGLQARRRLYFVASRTRGAAPGASKVYLDLCREALDEITRYPTHLSTALSATGHRRHTVKFKQQQSK